MVKKSVIKHTKFYEEFQFSFLRRKKPLKYIPHFFLIYIEPKISKIHEDLTKLWPREHFHSSQRLEATPYYGI